MRIERRGAVTLYDYEPRSDFAADVAAGLRGDPPCIPSKYLYDEAGSVLFEEICDLPEYYLTRTELALMREQIGAMAQALGPRCAVVEPGSGSGVKTRLLLSQLADPVAYIPVDISSELLLETAIALSADFPRLEVAPVCADYHSGWTLPPLARSAQRSVLFFPGSTVGNMEPREAEDFLRHMLEVCGPGAGMLVGVDLRKDPVVIAAAYDDSAGVTRAFNLNLVARLNRELELRIPPDAIAHETQYNEQLGRNESYLAVLQPLMLDIQGQHIELPAGTRIVVEHSYKYSLAGFAELAERAGLRIEQVWQDERGWFSVQYLVAA